MTETALVDLLDEWLRICCFPHTEGKKLKNEFDLNDKLRGVLLDNIFTEQGLLLAWMELFDQGPYILSDGKAYRIVTGDRIRLVEDELWIWHEKTKHAASLFEIEFIHTYGSVPRQRKGPDPYTALIDLPLPFPLQCDQSISRGLLKFFREQLPKYASKRIVKIIKSMVVELRADDEIRIDQAVDITVKEAQKQHVPPNLIDKTFTKDFFESIGTHVPGFTFVRLKQAFRRDQAAGVDLPQLLAQIDGLFDSWESNPKI